MKGLRDIYAFLVSAALLVGRLYCFMGGCELSFMAEALQCVLNIEWVALLYWSGGWFGFLFRVFVHKPTSGTWMYLEVVGYDLIVMEKSFELFAYRLV